MHRIKIRCKSCVLVEQRFICFQAHYLLKLFKMIFPDFNEFQMYCRANVSKRSGCAFLLHRVSSHHCSVKYPGSLFFFFFRILLNVGKIYMLMYIHIQKLE